MGGLFGKADPLSGFLMKGPDPLRDAIMPVVAKAPKLPDPLLKAATKAGVPTPPMLDMSDEEKKRKAGSGYG